MGRASRRKQERRLQRPQRFESMSLVQAGARCGRPWDKKTAVQAKCPVCDGDVYLHCADCQIQVTGCLCTAVDRMTKDDLRQFKEEMTKRRAREAGIVVPRGRLG